MVMKHEKLLCAGKDTSGLNDPKMVFLACFIISNMTLTWEENITGTPLGLGVL